MENNEILKQIEELKLVIHQKDTEINELKEHLKKYTAPERNKKYYENNKDKILKRNKEYKEKNNIKKIDPDKIKEYNRKAYLKKKLKNNRDHA